MQHTFLHLGRFSTLAWFILVQLEAGPQHVAGLYTAIKQDLLLEPGTLYGALARLERQGWIEPLETAEHTYHSYRLTAAGEEALQRTRDKMYGRRDHIGPHSRFYKEQAHMLRIVIRLLRLYPPAWRERYEQEMIALLEMHEITLFTLLDLLLGAFDARLDPQYRSARALFPTERADWFRFATSVAFCSFPVLIFFYFICILDSVDGPWDTLRNTDVLVSVAYKSAAFSVGVAWLAILLAAVLNACIDTRRADSRASKRLRFLPLASLLFPPVPLLFHFFVPIHALDTIEFILVMLCFLAGPFIVALAVGKRRLSERMLRLFLLLGSLTTLGVAGYVAGLLVCQLATSLLWPGGNWSLQLAIGFVLMALPVLAAAWALVRGLLALFTKGPTKGSQTLPPQSLRQA